MMYRSISFRRWRRRMRFIEWCRRAALLRSEHPDENREGRGFKSCRFKDAFGIVAQVNSRCSICCSFFIWSVRLTVRTPGFHPGNEGSIPLQTTITIGVFQLVEFMFWKHEVAGSSPVSYTSGAVEQSYFDSGSVGRRFKSCRVHITANMCA